MNNTPGKIIIVGASSGLGKAVAQTYARRGWIVGVCARREEALRELADAFPTNVHWVTLDVTSLDCEERLRELIDQVGGMDVILYAAGCGWNNPELKTQADMRTVQTNVDGFTRIVNAAFKWFAKNNTPSGRRGSLCAITSIAGTKGIGISATYSASKRYQTTYLQALSQLANHQKVAITITDIRPGFINTALLDTTAHKYPMLMSVDYAAKRIVHAIDHRRKIAYIDWKWHVVVALWRCIPNFIWRHLKLNI